MSAKVTEAHRAKAAELADYAASSPIAFSQPVDVADRIAQALADAEAAERERIIEIFQGWFGKTITAGAMRSMVDQIRGQS